MRAKWKRSNNRIYVWIIGLLVALVVLSAAGVRSAFTESLALEQNPRCGLKEHVHMNECYVGDLLLCKEKMHTHTENCYLVLLQDNDINNLLTRLDMAEDRSLESMIRGTVVQAVVTNRYAQASLNYSGAIKREPALQTSVTGQYAEPSAAPAPSILPVASPSVLPSVIPSTSPSLSPSESPSLVPSVSPSLTPSVSPSTTPGILSGFPDPVTSQEIAQLNAVTAANESDGGVVLNENLAVQASRSLTPSETELLDQLLMVNNTGASTYAIGGNASTESYAINFYINLDGSVKLLDIGALTYNNSQWDNSRKEYMTTQSAVAIYQNIVRTNLTTSNLGSSYRFRFNTNGNTNNFNTSAAYSDGKVYFGNSANAQYAILTNNSNTQIKFYTVTLNFEGLGDGTPNQVQYVESGMSSTLVMDDIYDWYDSPDGGNKVTSSALNSITKTTTLYAQARGYNITYQDTKGNTLELLSMVEPGSLHNVKAPADFNMSNSSYVWILNGDAKQIYRGGEEITLWEHHTFTLTPLHNVYFVDTDGRVVASSLTVVDGSTITLPNGYVWAQGGKEYLPGDTSAPIESNTTFVGTRLYNVTYHSNTGLTISPAEQVREGETVTLPTGYIWTMNGTPCQAGVPIAIREDTAFVGTVAYNVIYYFADGTTETVSDIPAGTTIILPATKGSSNVKWSDGVSGYSSGAVYTVNRNVTFVATEKLIVSYVYSDRTATIETDAGTSVRLPTDLPSGYVWVDSRTSASYAGGTTVTVNWDTTFYARQTLKITYAINFPGTSTIRTSTTVTLPGYSGAITVAEGNTTVVLTPSDILVVGTRTIENSTRNCVAYFEGWSVSTSGGSKIIRAGTRLTWEELQSYASSDGTVTFTGDWNTQNNEIARFFVRLDSTAANFTGSNIDTSTSKYTGEVFTTYVGGNPNSNFKIEDDTPDNSYTADQEIRSLLGERDGTWLYSLPTDEEIFAALKQYTSTSLSESNRLRFVDANGRTVEYVNANELDSNHYAIRWYVCKSESDGWHIDGRLVKKVGVVHVEKTFAGNEELIEAGKTGFYITATNTGSTSRKVLLKLSQSASVSAPSGITETLAPYSVSADGMTYIWRIEDIEYNEPWTISEHRVIPEHSSAYTEYSVYDSEGTQSAISRYGTSVTVRGVTYAPDENNDHIIRVEFRNFFLRSDSIAIKKEDGKSGQPISGAVFELWQQLTDVLGNKTWVQLKFRKDGNNLVFDQENGTIYQISTGATGYSEIIIEDFSYEAGPVLVREVGAPAGYVPAPEIILKHTGDTSGIDAEIDTVGGEAYDPNDPDDHLYAEYHSDERVLVVKNYSQTTTVVTAKKTWNVPEALWADSVTVELYANGVLASSLVPSIEPIVELTRANNYSYTWTDMPTYINGAPVVWTMKEIKVGSEELTVNGSFVNWIDSYNRYETRNADGELTRLTLEVVNDIRRTMLKVEKTDETGLKSLSGAGFLLTAVDSLGRPISGGYNLALTTDENGWASFDNLTAGFYALVEERAPGGYTGIKETIYLYVDAGGKIKQATLTDGKLKTLADNQFTHGLSRPSDFTVRVPNQTIRPLPETGGAGTVGFTVGGLLLMGAAVLTMIHRQRRKEETPDA